jgi:hypothetical protein
MLACTSTLVGPIRFLVLAGILAGTLAACDPGAFLAIENQSSNAFVLRYQSDRVPDVPVGPQPRLFAVPRNSTGVAIPLEIGQLTGTVDLLLADCSPVGHWRTTHGGMVTIDESGSASFKEGGPAPPVSTPTLNRIEGLCP